MERLIDMTGRTCGFWRVESYTGAVRWNCVCACGTRRSVQGGALRSGLSKSCGCGITGRRSRHVDLSGQRFGKLQVLLQIVDRVLQGKQQQARWLCRCDCGEEAIFFTHQFRSSKSRPCKDRCDACSRLEAEARRKPPEGTLSAHELARAFQVTKVTILRAVAAGDLRPLGRTDGGVYYFSEEDGLRALQRRRARSPGGRPRSAPVPPATSATRNWRDLPVNHEHAHP